MRVDNPLPYDPTPTDAPPSYGATQADKGHSPESSDINDSKTKQTSSPSPVSLREVKTRALSNHQWSSPNADTKLRTSLDIRKTVLSLMHDLVLPNTLYAPVAVNILNSCMDACATYGVSFSDILQQRHFSGRTAIYWVIVRAHIHGVGMNQGTDLLTALIRYASPLTEGTITEIRQACLNLSNQNLFQRLRLCPGVARMSTTDKMLLGVKVPPDEIEVQEIEESFVVNLVIPHFLNRMAITKSIQLEFITKGRLWRFTFLISAKSMITAYGNLSAGTWCISLSLQESSPPTTVDGRLLIFPYASSSVEPDISAFSLGASLSQSCQCKLITFPFHSKSQVSNKCEMVRSIQSIAPKLQHFDHPYIDSDGKLRARIEACLTRTDTTKRSL